MRRVHKDIGRNRTDKPSLPCGQDSQGRDENISAHVLSLDKLQDWTQEWIKRSCAAGKWSSNSVINPEGEILDARLKPGYARAP